MSQVNQIKDSVNILDEIGQRLDLKRAGSSYKALCPFHSEKSPSFFVNPQIQRYKCFGCGASGDVIEFLEQYEGMTFLEALQYLADKTGIKLKQFNRTKDDEVREQLLEILQLASRYYGYLLNEHRLGKDARLYLKKRGVNQSSIELFKIGYAPPAWDGLVNYLTKKKKFQPSLVEKTGLLIRNNSGRYYDRFRNRIVFPLKNHRGQMIGFSGRILESKKNSQRQQPKYINTPETQLYHKSQTLYGFSELFQQIRKKREVIVAEGEFDVISSHQVHVSNIVAIKGSALTKDQVKMLSRVADKILLCLDSDEAGIKATKRAIDVAKDLNMDLRVIDLSDIASGRFQDADELIRSQPKLWKKAVKNSISVYDFLIDVSFEQNDPDSAIGRRKIIDELALILNKIDHQVEKDFYLKKLAERLQVSASILQEDINRFGQQSTRKTYQNKTKQSTKQDQLDPLKKLEDYLLFLLINSADESVVDKAGQLSKLGLKNPQAHQILSRLIDTKGDYQLEKFAGSLAEDLKAALMEWQHPDFIKNMDDFNLENEWAKSLNKYQNMLIKDKINLHNQELATLEKKQPKTDQDNKKIEALLNQIAQLQAQHKS
jgi:DNA primase